MNVAPYRSSHPKGFLTQLENTPDIFLVKKAPALSKRVIVFAEQADQSVEIVSRNCRLI